MNEKQELEELQRKVEDLSRQNDLLRSQFSIEGVSASPTFDPREFGNQFQYYMKWGLLLGPVIVLIAFAAESLANSGWRSGKFGPLVFLDLNGMSSGMYGVSLGWIAIGNFAVGLFALGGGAIGAVAVGGGALGIIAFGGGAIGLFAWGGGSLGLVAVGGDAIGYYALCRRGKGKYVLSLRRQDRQAVELFSRYLPRLRRAITQPLPVVPLS